MPSPNKFLYLYTKARNQSGLFFYNFGDCGGGSNSGQATGFLSNEVKREQ